MMDIEPSDILARRLQLIGRLLGPGWLGFLRYDRKGRLTTGRPVSTWAEAEACYSRVVDWLVPGLDNLTPAQRCSPADRRRPDPASSSQYRTPGAAAAPALAAPVAEPLDGPHDAPVHLLHMLRHGLEVSPAGVRTCAALSAATLLHGLVPALAFILHVHERQGQEESPPARTLVLLAGIPGSGKSVLADVLERLSNLLPDGPHIEAIGMDGWHLPSQALRGRHWKDESGRTIPLASRKGSVTTFDTAVLTAAMRRLRNDRAPLWVPVYDRQLHEPVAEARQVQAPIVLLEGNYLLLNGQGYDEVGRQADLRLWLDVPIEQARRAIIRRHVAGGRPADEAEGKWLNNDWPNSLTALAGRTSAEGVFQVDPHRNLRFVHRFPTLRAIMRADA